MSSVRIQRLLTDDAGAVLAGLRVRVTRLGGNTPQSYSLIEDGSLIRDGNSVTSDTGEVDVWVTDSRGARISVFHLDGTLAYTEECRTVYTADDVSGSDPGDDQVPIPERIALGFKTVTLAAAATRVVDVIVVYTDGTIVRNPVSGVTAVSATPAAATVVAATRTLTAVATGSSVVTFTYTLGTIVLTDTVTVTVS
jgi:hypothetical protein